MGMFSSHRTEYVYVDRGDPNPKNFDIIRSQRYGRNVLLEVVYPDATNYEGKKIMILEDFRYGGFTHITELDPHFKEGGNVVARFEPTERGWQMGLIMLELF